MPFAITKNKNKKSKSLLLYEPRCKTGKRVCFQDLKDLLELLTAELFSPTELVFICFSPILPRSREILAKEGEIRRGRELGGYVEGMTVTSRAFGKTQKPRN